MIDTQLEYDAENDENMIVEIQNAHHVYPGGTYALKGVHLQIPKGHVFGLLGSNGSGKSTLTHCLAGIYKPTAGEAIVKYQNKFVDLFKSSQNSKYFSVVPQHDIYWPNLSVYDHMVIMQKLNALPHPIKIDLLIEALHLEDVRDTILSQLSGGMKRRLSIAMAMSTSPTILALDEPSCGLGVTTKRFVHDAILSVLGEETTLVLTTHDMEEVESLVDSCCILNEGRVLASGSISSLRKSCKVSFELTLRSDEETIEKLCQELKVYERRYNEVCDVHIIQLQSG